MFNTEDFWCAFIFDFLCFFFVFLCTFFAFFASADRRRRYIRYRDNIGYPRYGESYNIGDNQYSSKNLSYCPINRFLESVPTLTSCLNCPGNSTSVKGSDKPELCFCDSGFEQSLSFDKCTECRPGFYDNTLDSHECSSCGAGLYSASWGAKGPETCKECRPGTWSEIGSPTCQMCPPNSNSSVKSGAITD